MGGSNSTARQSGKKPTTTSAPEQSAADGPGPQGVETVTETRERKFVVIKIPVGDAAAGTYTSKHVDVNLNPRRGQTLKRLYAGLAGERLSDDKTVSNHNRVLPWILDAVADAIEAAEPTQPGDESDET